MTLALDRLFERAYENRQLLYVSLELTYNCNFACKFCYNPIKRGGQERKAGLDAGGEKLSLEEIRALLAKLRESGVLFLTLTGGEPLLHKDFWKILEEACSLSFAVRVFTNGALIDEAAADRLQKSVPYCVEMSIYGASEEGYRETNDRPGEFRDVVRAVKLLKERGIKLFLKCVLTRMTEKEMDKIQDLADSLDCELRWDPVLSPSEDGLEYPLRYRASDEGLEKLLGDPRFKVGVSPFDRGEGDSVCNIGRISLDIDPFGYIKPCIQWKEPVGNVRRDDIMKVWKESPELTELIELSRKSLENIKDITEDHAYCFNCIGRSKLLYGDPTVPDACELKIAALRKKYSKARGG